MILDHAANQMTVIQITGTQYVMIDDQKGVVSHTRGRLMIVKGYEIVVEIDGTKSAINLDDLYPSIKDWHTATDFAMKMA